MLLTGVSLVPTSVSVLFRYRGCYVQRRSRSPSNTMSGLDVFRLSSRGHYRRPPTDATEDRLVHTWHNLVMDGLSLAGTEKTDGSASIMKEP